MTKSGFSSEKTHRGHPVAQSKAFKLIYASVIIICAELCCGSELTRSDVDCGPKALWLLMQSSGRGTPYDAVKSGFISPSTKTQSLEEMIRAAGLNRFVITARRIHSSEPLPQMPMIAYLEVQKPGHYVVLRPVGSTRTMVQIIDPPYPPLIVDTSSLRSGPGWTGIVLIQNIESQWSRCFRIVFIILICFSGLVICVRYGFRSKQRGNTEASEANLPDYSGA